MIYVILLCEDECMNEWSFKSDSKMNTQTFWVENVRERRKKRKKHENHAYTTNKGRENIEKKLSIKTSWEGLLRVRVKQESLQSFVIEYNHQG